MSRRRTTRDSPGADRQPVVGGHLGAGLLRVYRLGLAVHQVVVDTIFHVGGAVWASPKDTLVVGFVFGKEQRQPSPSQ